MKRYVYPLALAIVAVWADGASAFFRCWCAPPPYAPYSYPVPIFRPQVVPIYGVPFYGVPLAPPTIYQAPPQATTQPKTEATPPRQPPMVTITPGVEKPPMVTAEVDPMVKPAAGGLAKPTPAPAPMTPITIPDPMVPAKPPPLVLPPIPGSDDKPLNNAIPSAVPMPAPAPKTMEPLPAIPLPEPKKVPNGKEELPPLVLPPETPGSPSGVIPSISRSNPLVGAVKVQVFAAAGTATGTLRKVGFFNHTSRDLDLVIDGKSVKLPKKSFMNAELPAKFVWKHSDGQAETATVPEGAAGLDVLFKE